MGLRGVKRRRFIRLSAQAALREFYEPFFNRAQILQLIIALIGTWFVLQTADWSEAYSQVSGWIAAAQAFGIVLVGWALLSLARAPFVVRREETAKGLWRDNTFSYHHPQHIFTRQFFERGITNVDVVHFPDAEPNSLVWYSIDYVPPRIVVPRISAKLSTGPAELEDMSVLAHGEHGTAQIGDAREATLLVCVRDDSTDVVCRVYCHSFTVGSDVALEGG